MLDELRGARVVLAVKADGSVLVVHNSHGSRLQQDGLRSFVSRLSPAARAQLVQALRDCEGVPQRGTNGTTSGVRLVVENDA